MGCSQSDLLTVTKNAVSPSQFFDRNGTETDTSTALTSDQLEKVQVTWKLIGNDSEFLTLVMIRYIIHKKKTTSYSSSYNHYFSLDCL